MKIASLVVSSLIAMMFQQVTLALEPSAQVQVSTVLKAHTSWDGKPIVYPSGKAEVSGLVVELAPGAQTGWHSHPVPSFAFILEGELEIEQRNGGVKRLKAGEAVAEVVNTFHNGRNVGTVPVRLVVFYTGMVGEKLTVKENQQ
ncbi:MAG: cupin domain-containing protein [Betaproteobacteria bacterium]|nr:cupin domain-containing protein [Betaproteobacteria bacterium]